MPRGHTQLYAVVKVAV